MANIINKFYKKIANNGNDSDYELVGEIGVEGVSLNIMQGASSSVDGEIGLVPKPTKGNENSFLCGNGTWKSEDALIKLIADNLYPVGSIYFSVTNTNPSSKFGGTWVSWGSGRVPVGVNSNDGNFNSVEKTGGSSSHSHTISVGSKSAFTSGSTTLSTSQIPSHTHSGTTGVGSTNSIRVVASAGNGCLPNHSTGYGGGSYVDRSGQNFPGSSHSHPFTTNATGGGGGHTHSIPAHNHTASSSSVSTLQPYITCYMWKRTA